MLPFSLGARVATEDVDVFIKAIDKAQFGSLYASLRNAGFWCLNGESDSELYSYLAEGLALRFACEGTVFPNFEVKFAKKFLDLEAFSDVLNVIMPLGALKVSSLERQIAFKRYWLKSEKDLADAEHLEKVFKDKLDSGKMDAYRRLIGNEMAETRQE